MARAAKASHNSSEKPAVSFLDEFKYYHSLWLLVTGLFLILYLAKRLEKLLFGLSTLEIVCNLFAPLLLTGVMCLILGLLSATLARLGQGKIVSFAGIFSFFSVNTWSFKSGAAALIAGQTRSQTGAFFGFVFVLVLVLSLWIAKQSQLRWSFLDSQKERVLVAFAIITLLSGLALLGAPSYHPPTQRGEQPNVIIVSFDSLNAQSVGCMGYHRPTTPNIDAFAETSCLFKNTRAAFNVTPLSLRSIAGTLPRTGKDSRMLPSRGSLFDLLAAKGYRNQAYFSHRNPQYVFGRQMRFRLARSGRRTLPYRLVERLLASDHLIWLSAILSEEVGFLWPYSSNYDETDLWKTNRYPGGLSVQDALEYLGDHPTNSFVWVHLWEPHYPYWPGQEFQGRFSSAPRPPANFINRPYQPEHDEWVASLKDLYDESVLEGDALLGRFLEGLKERGLFENSLIVVVSDHGESFSLGYVGHSGPSLCEEITHVPLLIHRPQQTGPVEIDTLAGHLDIAPTILDMLGLPPSPTLAGESLLPYVKSNAPSDKVKFSISFGARINKGGEIALYWKNYKALYWSHRPQNVALFDLSSDPEARKNVALQKPEVLDTILKKSGLR